MHVLVVVANKREEPRMAHAVIGRRSNVGGVRGAWDVDEEPESWRADLHVTKLIDGLHLECVRALGKRLVHGRRRVAIMWFPIKVANMDVIFGVRVEEDGHR